MKYGDTLPSFDYSMPNLTPNFPDMQAPTIDMRPSWHQLIVIGNGFDLECQLKSGFSSFLNARSRALSCDEDDPDGNPLGFKRCLWDVILDHMDGEHWADVEGAIARWIVPTGREGTNPKRWKSTLDKTCDVLVEISEGRKNTYDQHSLEDNVALYLCEGSPSKAREWNRERLLELTHHDLSEFEDEFKVYLIQAEKDQPDYRENARKLMCELILQGRPKKDDYDIEESVLSFNYTHPIQILHSEEHVTSYVNIHGRLDGEIVFGIDGTGRMGDLDVMPYTKTYRLLSLDVPDTRSLVHAAPLVGYQDYGTALIKFYGHSLGPADYAYFQAIFDTVRLYEGNTQLIFFYRVHGGKTVDEVKVETMRQVINLLDAYGRTLDNKDHGKNLIHKLLIEGRLAVKELLDTVERQ